MYESNLTNTNDTTIAYIMTAMAYIAISTKISRIVCFKFKDWLNFYITNLYVGNWSIGNQSIVDDN